MSGGVALVISFGDIQPDFSGYRTILGTLQLCMQISNSCIDSTAIFKGVCKNNMTMQWRKVKEE